MHRVTLVDTDICFQQDETHDTLLRAGLSQGIGLPYECNSGGCGSCKFELLEGELEELWPDAPALTARDRKKGRKLACQCRALSDLVIRMRTDESCVPVHAPARQQAVLEARRDITPDIVEFRLRTESPAHFQPGQYAMLTLPGTSAPRAYSMSNLANDNGIWEFWIRRKPDGAISPALFDSFHPGDTLALDGPYGLAVLNTGSPRDVVCIAGGSGISPVLSIARGLLRSPELADRALHFFLGARTRADICGLDELAALPGFDTRVTTYIALSDASPDEGWEGATGFIHELVAKELGPRLAEHECYLAGPPPMVQATTRMLMLDHKVPQEQVHFDRFF
ncbi:2Fe-2S iron-sulfur cluster-binding protein [Alcanivorax quisquiliarum]|uniref:FAD-binding oxidoreductase n=1 Tax=Alcanivorax quisquiliarum TaxID=2933565 RepID=A0ABT0E5Z0_9GAMM|nr:2Fe-2S iron-sulfur cluster-binding protein [Alcanivorax quisquiliarum]MCK0537245.1 FAD-binding oxidoreductase [Alcanivorax quisquiliarum]